MTIRWAIFLISWLPIVALLVVAVIARMAVRDVQMILMGLALIPALAFLVRYARMRWWRHIEGRNMIGINLVVATYLIVALAAYPTAPRPSNNRWLVHASALPVRCPWSAER